MLVSSKPMEQQKDPQIVCAAAGGGSPRLGSFVRNKGSYQIANLLAESSDHIKNPAPGQLSRKKTALISGAGIAGLATAFELNKKGFDVTVVEKRSDFSRFNIINLNKEVQDFLRRFDLLAEFEIFAARIKKHYIVNVGTNGITPICDSDVSKFQFEGTLDRNPETFKDLFGEDGIYSVHIKDLQAFLAKKATKLGVKILSDSEIQIANPIENGRVSNVEIIQKNGFPLRLNPDLFFIAEGAHSTSAQKLRMVDNARDVVENDCTGENWIFGNLKYSGSETFVISMCITAQKTLQIANVIFNAKTHTVNVAVTSDANPTQAEIDALITEIARKAFEHGKTIEPIKPEQLEIIDTIKKPVTVINRMASVCSQGNVFEVGDTVGYSSPLAGLGGTLGLTLVPCTVEQLLDGYQQRLDESELHRKFQESSQAYVSTWIKKSQAVKGFLVDFFAKNLSKDQSVAVEVKDAEPHKEGQNGTE